jgi:hypothetical protein
LTRAHRRETCGSLSAAAFEPTIRPTWGRPAVVRVRTTADAADDFRLTLADDQELRAPAKRLVWDIS